MRVSMFFLIAFSVSSLLFADDNWPELRGPSGNGHAPSAELPLTWSEEDNVVWKTPIHDRGWSSPVIWGDQIWVTTATADGRRLFAVCVDKDSGEIVHDIHVFDVERPENIAAANSYASPTPVIEEGRIYVHFGTYGTACLDTKTGDVLWTRRDLNCNHEAGPGSSPFLVGDMFIFHVGGQDAQYTIALDKKTGETVWKTDRAGMYGDTPVNQRKDYCMPIVIPRGDGTQLISSVAKSVFAYDPDTGDELWQVKHRGWSMTARPVYGNGLLFVVVDYDYPELWAIRPDGVSDVTETHVEWRATRSVPARSSPLLIGDLLFLVDFDGVASCLDAKTGEHLWRERLRGQYSASPIYANDRIYFFNEDAVCTVVAPSREFEVLSENALAEQQLMASPAVSGDSLFVRTEHYLYRIEETSVE